MTLHARLLDFLVDLPGVPLGLEERKDFVRSTGLWRLAPDIQWDGAPRPFLDRFLVLLAGQGRDQYLLFLEQLPGALVEPLGVQDRATWEGLCREVAAVADLAELQPPPPCPYPGMVPFSEAQRSSFFGREREIEDAVQHLRLHPLLAIIGSSGSGKSSLAFAGVLPALRRSTALGGERLQVIALRPGADPALALAAALACDPSVILAHTRTLAATAPLLLLVDQFEELFSVSQPAGAAAFIELLLQLAAVPGLYLLLTVRADFYPDVLNSPLWPAVKDHRLELTALRGDGLAAAMVKPAAQVGVTLDPALVERLLADAAGEPGALPFIQETLVLLWDRVEGQQLSLNAYAALTAGHAGRSGLQIAMARRADQTLSELDDDGKALARRTFLRLVQFGEGRPDTRRQQAATTLRDDKDEPATFDRVLQQLVSHRLLTLSGGEDIASATVDIAHEALIGGWPRLRGWIDQRRDAEQVRRRLEAKAAEWVRLGRGEGGRLDESELPEAERWLTGADAADLGAGRDLVALVAKSRAVLAAQTQAEEEARRRELEQAQAQASAEARAVTEARNAASLRRRALLLAGALIAALILAGVASWLFSDARSARDRESTARVAAEAEAQARATAEARAQEERAVAERAASSEQAQRTIAQRQERIALSNQLAAGALSQLGQGEQVLPLLLASEAMSRTFEADALRLPAAEEALRAALAAAGADPLTVTTTLTDVRSLAFDATDGVLLAVNGAGDLVAWQAEDGAWLSADRIRQIEPPPAHDSSSRVISPDGRWAATESSSAFIRLEDLTAAGEPALLVGHNSEINALEFSADSRFLASGDDAGVVRLWQLDDPQHPSQTVRGHDGAVRALAFAADGSRLATGGDDAVLRLWDVADLSSSIALHVHRAPLAYIAFSADDRWFASADVNGVLYRWRNRVDDLLSAACIDAGRNLTVPEWVQHLGSQPYRWTCPDLASQATAGLASKQVIDAFLAAGRELNRRGWDLLSRAGLDGLLYVPQQVDAHALNDALGRLEMAEQEVVGRMLSAQHLRGARPEAGLLWRNQDLLAAPAAPPPAFQVQAPADADSSTSALVDAWNRYGGLISAVANALGIDPDLAAAILVVETSGRGDDGEGRLLIRFENHIFYDYWGKAHPEQFGEHFRFDPDQEWTNHVWRPDADGEWQPVHGSQDSEWAAFAFARTLDDVAAVNSISMGAPQIMGFNAAGLGFGDVRDMLSVLSSPTVSQFSNVILLFDFVLRNQQMLAALQAGDVRTFVTLYNGPGQADLYTQLVQNNWTAMSELRAAGARP